MRIAERLLFVVDFLLVISYLLSAVPWMGGVYRRDTTSPTEPKSWVAAALIIANMPQDVGDLPRIPFSLNLLLISGLR